LSGQPAGNPKKGTKKRLHQDPPSQLFTEQASSEMKNA
jgi:hypothetical protein